MLIAATDAAGNQSVVNQSITRDTTPPVITLTQPANDGAFKDAQVNVAGTYSDATATSITVNGIAATVSGNNFSAVVPINEGTNQLQVAATDAAGNHSELTRNIVGDTTAPVLTLSQPLDGDSTNQTQLAVSGTFSDATTTTVQVNNVPAEISGNSFTATVSLNTDGAHPLTVQATDAAGNQSVVTLSVTRDTVAPALTVTAPTNGLVGNEAAIEVSGSATDAAPVTVTANDTPLTVNEGGLFSGRILLAEGDAQVLIVAMDAAGNMTEQTRSLVIDQTPPNIENIQPPKARWLTRPRPSRRK